MTDYATQAHFNNYDPSSFGWPRQADLVPFVYQGVNFGQAARAAVPVFTAVLDELVPLIPGGIVAVRKIHDDWAYSPTDDLPDGSWSFHHYGIAFDLDWQVDPMGTYTSNPLEGQQGAIPHAAASRIARKYGCEYGGDWSGGPGVSGFKDYMHFEIHLSPAVARTVQPIATPHPSPHPNGPPVTPTPPSDFPTSGPLADRWTNPDTGVKRTGAGWIIQIVNLLRQIAQDTAAIRKHLGA